METQNPEVKKYETRSEPNRSGRTIAGMIVVIVGSIFLAKQLGVDFPYWMFRWESFMIALGLFLGFRHNFKGFAWLIVLGIGLIFLLDEIYPYVQLDRLAWPIIIICIGLFMIFRPRRSEKKWKTWDAAQVNTDTASDDYIDSTAVFGGVKKNVISKTFRGGEATTFFGGTEINLMQADVPGKIVLDVTNVFGGTKLIVPPHWKINSEDLVCILGGIEDKRPIMSDPSSVDPNKVLVLKGTCIFGGIDIKSY
jgi:predicted membrane protein